MKQVRVIIQFFFISAILLLVTNVNAENEQSLQQLINNTPVNGVLQLKDKVYDGNIFITKPITLIGNRDTIIRGLGTGNVITVNSSFVHLENISVMNSGQDRNSGEEYAAIKLLKDNNSLKNITVTNSFHGVYLSQSHNNIIESVKVIGRQDGEIAGQGNGLHLYYSNNNILKNNTITGTRDGIFFDYANGNIASQNTITHTRYGLHYMYSDDNQFAQNIFSYNLGGAAIMHSRRTTLNHNQFILNQGTRSYGLLLQASNESIIMENFFFQNQRGIYVDQSQNNQITGNKFLQNQIGVEVWASSTNQIFSKNEFMSNVAAVLTLGGKDKNKWNKDGFGNYWGPAIPVLDLDQNGIGDAPVQYKSSLYKLVEENELAFLFLNSPSIKIYEKMNELIDKKQVMLADEFPLLKHSTVVKTNNIMAVLVLSLLLIILKGTVQRKRRREL
ncbi:nitrous oxide reductase family maturation protein NosD [Bacillus sp. HMF5848]|uniref:nitrous oxide reductase family maturation protein NosD n=1 Tax=Bacillus sp. HMF5848 TaxID=2495421 RepID=UPI000F7AC697|nr:nitrous oxide reductase family maturation protein NosD [Bacillus sp. HMF5848]RSK26601.1 nitrous oxide reductase family maturation protein NosD [Bacillus sp. HMF5848]